MALDNFLIEPLHIIGVEGRLKSRHLIEDTAQRPYIRFVVVWFIFPDLWRGIVGCACLGIQESLLGDLGDVHVSQLNGPIFVEEYIS